MESRPHRPLVLGVLGGIASGKSAVARLLAGASGVVIDADQIARSVLSDGVTQAALASAFGPAILHSDGSVDREQLGRLVFGSADARSKLESFTHPRIRATIRGELAAARARGVPCIVLDVPLLLENDAQHRLVAECDALVFVDADPSLRDRRAVSGRGWASGEVARRERVQMSLAEKRARADHVLANDGTRDELEAAVASTLRAIAGRSRRDR
ncbi:MAG: dephospho-CoA kinase [Planctomycetota bacterium]|nr:dephospho-CoA kinase [Planctomycetota bacterium]